MRNGSMFSLLRYSILAIAIVSVSAKTEIQITKCNSCSHTGPEAEPNAYEACLNWVESCQTGLLASESTKCSDLVTILLQSSPDCCKDLNVCGTIYTLISNH